MKSKNFALSTVLAIVLYYVTPPAEVMSGVDWTFFVGGSILCLFISLGDE